MSNQPRETVPARTMVIIVVAIAVVLVAASFVAQLGGPGQHVSTSTSSSTTSTVSLTPTNGTTTIDGTKYFYESVQPPLNGSGVLFHGVTFTFLPVPFDSYSNPSNYTFRGSALLTNGTLLNLNGKTVVIEMVNVTGGLFGIMGVSLTFQDGYQAVHPVLNATARHQNAFNEIATPVVVLTYTSLPSLVNPWFTQHAGDSAGVFFDAATGASWTLYVSE